MPEQPEIVCLCSSVRFVEKIRAATLQLTLAGAIVLAPAEAGIQLTDEQRQTLSAVHRHEIDLADRVLVVNPGGYIGESTAGEIACARAAGKPVSFTG